jgi:hypothetical protein
VPVNQIPLTLITDYTQEPQKVYMLDLQEDTYQVYFLGKETGDFHLTGRGSSKGTLVENIAIQGSSEPNQILRSEMDVDLDADGKLAGISVTDPEQVDEITGVNIFVQQYVLDLINDGKFHFPADLVAGALFSPTPSPTGASTPTSTGAPTPTSTVTPTPVVLGANATPASLAAPTPSPTKAPTPTGTVRPHPRPAAPRQH